jgi:dienelactone hydrolase
MLKHRCLIIVAAAVALSADAAAAPIPPGTGQQVVQLGGTEMEVFTYRPGNCSNPSLLVVSHGVGRNASGYRDHVIPLAEATCSLVVAPLFDKERFPNWRFQFGGIVNKGAVQNPREWTGNLILRLVQWARTQERRGMQYALVGHSAGGQLLSRVAAFVPTEASRIVIANPSTWVFPTLQVPAPFGLGGVYPDAQAQAQLRRYLEQPITVLLGQADTGEEELDESPSAMAQGRTRYERGLNIFRQAKMLSASRGWPLNWRLVEVPGAGHSAGTMFRSQQMLTAMQP